MVTNALGSIFGWKYEASTAGIADDWSDMADSADDVAGSTGDAAANANKLKKNANAALRAFDELKTISLPKDKSGSGNSDSGSGSSDTGSGAASGGLVATDTIFKGYESSIKNLEQLGESISSALISAMQGIDWKLAADTFNTFAHGILDAADKAISGTNWDEIGEDIGTLLADIDWDGILLQVGEVIWDAINGAVDLWKGLFDKAPIETAILTAAGLLTLTGVGSKIVGKISSAVGTYLQLHGLSLGKITFGVSMIGATVFLADSENEVISTIGPAITAALAGYTFTGDISLALKIGAVTIAATGGFNLGKKIGEWIAEHTLPEDMKEYITTDWNIKDIFSYSLDD